MALLNIDGIVNINISVSEETGSDLGFNIGLIVGASGHISAATRIKRYASIAEMQADGFLVTDPEYQAAAMYFAQSPSPNAVYIGTMDGSEGSAETLMSAVEACWAINSEWYGLYVCDASDSVITEIAKWAAEHRVCFFYGSSVTEALQAESTSDIFSVVKALGSNNSFGIYSSVDHAAAAVMGLAMGLNDGTDDSAFTLAYKTLKNVSIENLTSLQVATLKSKNANVFLSRAGNYTTLEQGVNCDGTPFDEVLGLHQISGNIQTAIMDLLTNPNTRKIPYTDDGVMRFVSAINDVCAAARRRGFLAAGVWNGGTIMELADGDALAEGYYVQVETVAGQSAEKRKNRIAPPIYVCLKLAGAIEYAVISVTVER